MATLSFRCSLIFTWLPFNFSGGEEPCFFFSSYFVDPVSASWIWSFSGLLLFCALREKGPTGDWVLPRWKLQTNLVLFSAVPLLWCFLAFTSFHGERVLLGIFRGRSPFVQGGLRDVDVLAQEPSISSLCSFLFQDVLLFSLFISLKVKVFFILSYCWQGFFPFFLPFTKVSAPLLNSLMPPPS